VERDFAFAVASDVPAEKIVRAAKGADKALIQAVTLFDAFEGGSLGEGQKSIAFSVTLQAPDRTLTEDDIAAAQQKIVAAVTGLRRHAAKLAPPASTNLARRLGRGIHPCQAWRLAGRAPAAIPLAPGVRRRMTSGNEPTGEQTTCTPTDSSGPGTGRPSPPLAGGTPPRASAWSA
jgi:hypothetical protein